MRNKYVVVRSEFAGIHNWPECPFPEVAFLKDPHRHLIKVKVMVETGADRDLEFFMFKRHLENIIKKLYGAKDIKVLGRRSMEQIAEEILEEILVDEGMTDRYIEIVVSEDGESDGVIEYLPMEDEDDE